MSPFLAVALHKVLSFSSFEIKEIFCGVNKNAQEKGSMDVDRVLLFVDTLVISKWFFLAGVLLGLFHSNFFSGRGAPCDLFCGWGALSINATFFLVMVLCSFGSCGALCNLISGCVLSATLFSG